MPETRTATFVPFQFGAEPPVNQAYKYCKMTLLGQIEEQLTVNHFYYVVEHTPPQTWFDNEMLNALGAEWVTSVWPSWQALVGSNWHANYLGLETFTINGLDITLTGLGSVNIDQDGANVGPFLPSLNAALINRRYLSWNAKTRTAKTYIAGIDEGSTEGSYLNAGGLGAMTALVTAMAGTLTFAAEPLGEEVDAYPAQLRITAATAENAPTEIGMRSIAGIYGTDLISTMRRRKIGRGA